MNGNGHHWSKFAWRDWRGDPALHPCSLAAKGFWMELLCIMHEGSPVGYLTIGGKPATIRQMAANAYCSEKEAAKYLAELEEAGVFSRTADGTIYCRRMVKDAAASEAGREWGKKGGNPKLNGTDQTPKNPSGGITPPLSPRVIASHNGGPYPNPLTEGVKLDLDTDSESESKKGKEEREVRARGARLPADWRPSPDCEAYAVEQNLDPSTVYEGFRDFWDAKAGPDAVKRNWDATWRTWCRREAERGFKPRANGQQQPRGKLAWAIDSILSEARH